MSFVGVYLGHDDMVDEDLYGGGGGARRIPRPTSEHEAVHAIEVPMQSQW